MKQVSQTIFKDERGDGGVAEAARFVGAWAGCVPNSVLYKLLGSTIEGFEDLDDDALAEAFADALDLLRGEES